MKVRSKPSSNLWGLGQATQEKIVPFDVPGHKRGRGNPELVELLGEKCVGIDVNSMKPLDNLGHPISIIRDAEELAADALVQPMPSLMIEEQPHRFRPCDSFHLQGRR